MARESTPIHRPPPGGEYYVFRDNVHNLIEIDDADQGKYVRDLLMSREVQRLRFVRQNGVSFFVYPSLEVSRFPHALGSFHIARRLIASLRERQPSTSEGFPQSLTITPEDCFAFSIAALLHDIGHGPLSHVWEEIWAEPRGRRHYHEEMTRAILASSETEIGKKLSAADSHPKYPKLGADVQAFVGHTHWLSYLIPLLAGNLDVDRLDFTARDTRGAGVTYGFHDLEWIIRSLRFARLPAHKTEGEGAQWIIAIDGRKGLSTLVQFLHARENMYRLVYHHKTTRVISKMVELALGRASRFATKPEFPVSSPTFRTALTSDHLAVGEYLKLDDTDIWGSLRLWADYEEDPILRELASSINSRQLYKGFLLEEHVYKRLKEIDTPANGSIIREIVAARLTCSRAEAEFYYAFDEASFDVVGKTPAKPSQDVWILESGTLGFEYRTLRQYWNDEIGSDTSRRQYLLIVHPKLVSDIAGIVGQLGFPPLKEELWTPEATMPQPATLTAETTKAHVPPPKAPKPYEILGSLSAGAWKQAYAGVNTELGRDPQSTVALKRYIRDGGVVLSALARDVTAFNLLVRTPNDHLSKAKAIEEDGEIWIVEEPLWIASLEHLIDQQGPRRNLHEIFDIGAQLFAGLAALHKNNLRHTDIKPDNCGVVFMDKGEFRYVLGDFGCLSAQPEEVPKDTSLLGTLRTRSPETICRDAIGLPSDVWSMAATVYALCMLKYPFMGMKVRHESTATRSKREDEIKADMEGRLATFLNEAQQELPPVLYDVLLNAFAEVSKRRSASDMVRLFDDAKRSLENREVERIVWQRAEDLLNSVTASESRSPQLVGEINNLIDCHQQYIPPILIQKLRALAEV